MADATGNIIFTIGSKMGPGGMASLNAAIQLMGKAYSMIKDSIVELDKFAVAWDRTNQAAVIAADNAAAGLIDTQKVMEGWNRLAQAGAQVTQKEFETLAKRAVELAKATGGDATEAFNKLTTGIARGSSRALTEYGVRLKESTDLSKTQEAAIKAMTEGFEDLTVEAESTSEMLFALENNIGTFKALMWEATGRSETFGTALSDLNTQLGDFNRWLAESPETLTDFIFSIDGAKGALAEMGAVIVGYVLEPLALAEEFYRTLFNIGGGSSVRGLKDRIQSSLGDISSSVIQGANLPNRMEAERQARAAAGIGTGAGARGGRRGGGAAAKKGGGKKGPGLIEGYGATAMPDFGPEGGLAEMMEDDLVAINEAMEEYNNLEQTAFDLEMQRLEQHRLMVESEQYQREQKAMWREQELIQREEDALYYEYVMERHTSMHDQMLMEEQQYMMQSRKMWESGLKGKLQTAQIMMGAISSLQAFESKKNFNAMKGIRAAETTIAGLVAAWNAYSALAGIPYVGPALGAAAAIAIIAASAAEANKIANMSWEDAHGGGGGGGANMPKLGGGGGGGYTGPTAGGGMGGGGGEREVTVNIRMDDSASAWGLMVDENDKASQRGERSFKMS